jgi:hypothetical protein
MIVKEDRAHCPPAADLDVQGGLNDGDDGN